MITNVKEINKEFSLAKKHFNNAINMAKKGVVVGEINFPGKINFPAGEPMPDVSLHNRKPRKKRSKKNDPEDRGIVQNVPDDLLPDLDKPKKR